MSFRSDNASSGNAPQRGCGRRGGRANWTPIELAAMIIGFAVFWPIGLAILFFKIWQKKEGGAGDLLSFAQQRFSPVVQAKCERVAAWSASPSWRSWSEPSSGNAAFDEWRNAELSRLEEERKKLADAEREFADHLEKLRRARDRQEFEQFMSERRKERDGVVDV